MPLGSKLAPPRGSLFLHNSYIVNIFENLLLRKQKAQTFDILYVALPSGPLPRLFKLYPWGQNWPRPSGSLILHNSYIGKNLWKSSSPKAKGPDLWYFVCSIVMSSSTKIVQSMPLGSKLAPPRGSLIPHNSYMGEHLWKSSSPKPKGPDLWYFVCSIV